MIFVYRHMRTDTNKRIILNISINTLIVNLIFLIGIDERKNEALCQATSFILHYFTLCSWFWMFIEAIYLFLTLFLKDRSNIKTKKILAICGALAYGEFLDKNKTLSMLEIITRSIRHRILSLPNIY